MLGGCWFKNTEGGSCKVGPEKKAPRGPFSMSEPANYLADSGFFGSANLAPAELAK